MKQLIMTLVFLWSTVPFWGQKSFDFQVAEQEYELINEAGFTKILYQESIGMTEGPGTPELPYTVKMYVLPSGTTAADVVLSELPSAEVKGEYLIYPVQPPVAIGTSDTVISFVPPNPEVYRSKERVPAQSCEITTEEVFGYTVARVKMYPFAYIPSEKKLMRTHFRIQLPSPRPAVLAEEVVLPSALRAKLARDYVSSLVENPSDLSGYAIQQQAQLDQLPQSAETIIPLGTSTAKPDYIIITSEALKSSFSVLAQWKERKGIKTYIKTVEEIYRSYPGADQPEKIRYYINDCVNRWGKALMVLLAGDVNHVPARNHITKASEKTGFYPADNYYANTNLDVTWNANGNHIFGERADNVTTFRRDIVLGRIPAQTPEEATILIQKIIEYEKADQSLDYSYYNNCLMAVAPITLGSTPAGDYNSATREMISLYTSFLKDRMNSRFLLDDRYISWPANATELQKITGLYDPLYRESFLNAINTVNSFKPHIVYHMDHASSTTMGIANKTLNQRITCLDVNAMKNGKYYQILMSSGCNPANFSVNSIGEHFLFKENGGTVAFLGNTDVGYADEGPMFSYFLKGVHNDLVKRLGFHFNSMYYYYSSKWNMHLLGDPEMPVWTASPKTIGVNITNQAQSDLSHTLTVTISGLTGQGMLCISKGEEMFYTAEVSNGMYRYSFTLEEAGEVSVVVTADGYCPSVNQYACNSAKKTVLKCTQVSIDDSATGNNDGRVDAGESMVLKLTLQNGSAAAVSNLQGTVTCDEASIGLTSPSLNWGTINANGVSTVSIPFSVDPHAKELLSSDPEAAVLHFEVKDGAGQSYYIPPVKLDVFAPSLNMELSGISTPPSAGATINTLNLRVTNAGLGEASLLTAELSGNIVGNSIVRSLGNLAYNENIVYNIPITIAGSYAGGALPITVKVTNKFGRQWVQVFNLTAAPAAPVASAFKFNCDADWIEVYWNKSTIAKGYNIYRCKVNPSNASVGNYQKQNREILPYPFYIDREVEPLSSYFYKVTIISAEGIESPLSNDFLASTSFATYGAFPIVPYEYGGSISMPFMTDDIDGDGKRELFTGLQGVELPGTQGAMLGFDFQGNDLFDLDNNVTTPSGFALTRNSQWAVAAIGPLRRGGKKRMVFADRGWPQNSQVSCYSFEDTVEEGKPDLIWTRDMRNSILTSVILANVDGSVDGSQEIIIRGEGNSPAGYQNINVLSENGETLYTFGDGSSYASLAVADLLGTGEKQIIAGFKENKVVAYRYNGTVFRTLLNITDISFRATPIVCDLDNDGMKEVLIMGRHGSRAYVFVRRADGTQVPGWNGVTQSVRHTDKDLDCTLAVGDLDNDGKLEVVAVGNDSIYIWRNDGSLLRQIYVKGLTNRTPLLADVDGRPGSEIIVTLESSVVAYDLEGNQVQGFPLQTTNEILRSSVPTIADVDGDGVSEILVSDKYRVYAWRTNGNPDEIHWGQAFHNNQHTNEYKWPAETIRSNKLWVGPVNPRGDVVVKKGILTLNPPCVLTMSNEGTIVVENGATLRVQGATLNNADIEVRSGGILILHDDCQINLRKTGGLYLEDGAILYGYGTEIYTQ